MGRDPFKEIVMEIINSEMKKSRLECIEEGELRGIKKTELKYKEEWDKSMHEVAKNMIKYNCTKEQVINSTNITEEEYLSLLEV